MPQLPVYDLVYSTPEDPKHDLEERMSCPRADRFPNQLPTRTDAAGSLVLPVTSWGWNPHSIMPTPYYTYSREFRVDSLLVRSISHPDVHGKQQLWDFEREESFVLSIPGVAAPLGQIPFQCSISFSPSLFSAFESAANDYQERKGDPYPLFQSKITFPASTHEKFKRTEASQLQSRWTQEFPVLELQAQMTIWSTPQNEAVAFSSDPIQVSVYMRPKVCMINSGRAPFRYDDDVKQDGSSGTGTGTGGEGAPGE